MSNSPPSLERDVKLIDIATDLVISKITDAGQDLIPGEHLVEHFPAVYKGGVASEIDELENDFVMMVDIAVDVLLSLVVGHDAESR